MSFSLVLVSLVVLPVACASAAVVLHSTPPEAWERSLERRPPIVAGGFSEKDRSSTPSPRRVFFPGNVMPRRNVALEEVDYGSVL